MIAFVLMQLKECDETKVMDDLKSLPEVKEAFVLFGEWDLILKVEIENAEALGKFMIESIRSMDDVKLTSTMIVAKS